MELSISKRGIPRKSWKTRHSITCGIMECQDTEEFEGQLQDAIHKAHDNGWRFATASEGEQLVLCPHCAEEHSFENGTN